MRARVRAPWHLVHPVHLGHPVHLTRPCDNARLCDFAAFHTERLLTGHIRRKAPAGALAPPGSERPMGILDKLRPQSKSTHPDPNIRIEAIHELDPADLESLNAFAKDDTDARVRRVAVARIGDASVLADIVRNESEGSVRDHALGQLVEQASKHDAAAAMTAVAALASLGRERELAHGRQGGRSRRSAPRGDCRRARREIAGQHRASRGGSRRAAGGARAPDRRRRDRRRGAARRARRCRGRRDRSPVESVERDADGDRREGAHQGGAEEGAHAPEGERAGGGAGREPVRPTRKPISRRRATWSRR